MQSDHLAYQEIEALRRQVEALTTRIEEHQADLGRIVLFLHAFTEACITKGQITRDDIADAAAGLDVSDGNADGQLDPRVLTQPGPLGFLAKLANWDPELLNRYLLPEEILKAQQRKK